MRKYTLLLSLLLVIGIQSVIAQGKIERLEPSFWWAGMKNPKLQLLVYGKHISDLDVSLTYPGVSIERVTKVKNPNYLFIDLLVSEGAAPGTFDIRFSSNKKLIQTYPYKLLQREA